MMNKSVQYSQLKTKYYGIVKGYFKNFKGIMCQKVPKKTDEKTHKDEYRVQLARMIGTHLLRKLNKTLRKHMRIQLNSIKNPEPEEEDSGTPESGGVSESDLPSEEQRKKPYIHLRPLVREEQPSISSEPQKFFDLLVL